MSEVRARWHANDPAPAREAAERHDSSGKTATHADMLLAVLRAHPGGLTRHEAAREVRRMFGPAARTIDHIEAQRRLSDLKVRGLASTGPARICGIEGRRMSPYVAVPTGNVPGEQGSLW